MAEAVIVAGVRSPFVKAGGALNETPAQELGRQAVRELLDGLDFRPEEVDELIAGNVASPPDATNVARVIALRSGIPRDRIAHTVARNCASGMESLSQAVERIEAGHAGCVVALGVESMSQIPVFWQKSLADKLFQFSRAKRFPQKLAAAARFRPRDLKPRIGLELGLTDPVSGLIMGQTAEKLAREFHIAREEQDRYALQSHQRAVAAWSEGRLAEETMTLYPQPDFQPVGQDVGPRKNQTLEALGKLRPYFDRRWGSVTVGNSSQVTDGAVALLVMDAEKAKALGLQPWGRIRASSYAGCDPARMGLGPVHATARTMNKAGMRVGDMQLVELNEAFAAQVLACQKCFDSPRACGMDGAGADRLDPLDEATLNVNGGAIALGHPVGASGGRLVLTLLHELGRRGENLGLATLCVGGGQGAAFIVERLAA